MAEDFRCPAREAVRSSPSLCALRHLPIVTEAGIKGDALRHQERKSLSRIKLHREHEVVWAGHQYVIRHHSAREIHESSVSSQNVRALYEAFKGRVVGVDDVLSEVEQASIPALRLKWNPYEGHKRKYEIQDILLVLCALGLATGTILPARPG